MEKQFVREEIACVLRLAPGTVITRLQLAGELVRRLSDTLAAVETGGHRVAVRAVPGRGGRVVDRGAGDAGRGPGAAGCGRQTLRGFRESVARAVLAIDPRTADERHHDADADRGVEARMLDHVMGSVHAQLSADAVVAIMTRVQAAEDTRTEDTRAGEDAERGSAAGGCVRGPAAGQDPASAATWQGRRPSVRVSVALSTLLHVDDEPGEVDGWSPTPFGGVIDAGRQAYEPPQDLAEHVMVRDRICRFPGAADAGNHECRCARHHHLKHEADWTVHRHPDGHTTALRADDDCPF